MKHLAATLPVLLVAASLNSDGSEPESVAVHPELMTALARLDAWLPGSWDNLPQILVERALGAPPDGEHEHWHRIITRIDAPQLGTHVYYGELYLGGPEGALVPGQQILYVAEIDLVNFAVNLRSGGVSDLDKFRHLHRRPELWSEVTMRPGGGRCLFLWRRSGDQVVGTLGTEGTCTVVSERTGKTMLWDAEWVLAPDQLWVFDNGYTVEDATGNLIPFMGREDRTHHRSWRARDYRCEVSDVSGQQALLLHDRGGTATTSDGLQLQLLRGPIASAAGNLTHGLQLTLSRQDRRLAEVLVDEASETIALGAGPSEVACEPVPADREIVGLGRVVVAAPSAAALASARPAAATSSSAVPAAVATGDPYLSCDIERGRSQIGLCETCHGIEPGSRSVSGPHLAGMFGRKAGTLKDFEYSNALQNSGLTWDRETLDRFLVNPGLSMPGTIMSFYGVRDAQARADLVCYLEQATRDRP